MATNIGVSPQLHFLEKLVGAIKKTKVPIVRGKGQSQEVAEREGGVRLPVMGLAPATSDVFLDAIDRAKQELQKKYSKGAVDVMASIAKQRSEPITDDSNPIAQKQTVALTDNELTPVKNQQTSKKDAFLDLMAGLTGVGSPTRLYKLEETKRKNEARLESAAFIERIKSLNEALGSDKQLTIGSDGKISVGGSAGDKTKTELFKEYMKQKAENPNLKFSDIWDEYTGIANVGKVFTDKDQRERAKQALLDNGLEATEENIDILLEDNPDL